METEKGKLYYCLKDAIPTKKGELFKGIVNERFNQGHFTEKIAVYCPTKDDKEYIAKCFNPDMDIRHEGFDFYLINERVDKLYMFPYNYIRISMDLFKKFYPENKEKMTKVTILGQSHEDEKPKRKIEFVKYLASSGLKGSESNPSDYDNIELVARNYTKGLDLMYAYYEGGRDTPSAILYLGHFNDGVV